jgi:hypothetical protein
VYFDDAHWRPMLHGRAYYVRGQLLIYYIAITSIVYHDLI